MTPFRDEFVAVDVASAQARITANTAIPPDIAANINARIAEVGEPAAVGFVLYVTIDGSWSVGDGGGGAGSIWTAVRPIASV